MHPSERVPRVPAVASSCRLGKGAKASGGTRWGTSGHQSGTAPRTWAFAEAATLFLRGNEPGPKSLARWEQTHAPGNARSLLAPTLARAVSGRRKRPTACAREPCLGPAGAERVRPAPHSPLPGGVSTRRPERRSGRRRGTRRAVSAPSPGAPRVAWTRALALIEAACDRRRRTCAAPPPPPRLTGELPRLRQAVESDGRRGRQHCSGAAAHRPAALPSSRPC